MEEKGFCLKWEKFLDVCKGTFSQLLKNEQFADVTLFCESQLIKCHRLVLSASSQYFNNLLIELNFPNPVIAMHNVKLQDLMAIITFIYTGEVTVSQDQLASLVRLGELLKVKGLGEDEDEKTEQTPDSVNRTKKPSSPVERKDSESTSAKRKKVDSDIGNGHVHFSQLEDMPLIGVVDVSESSFLPVKEEAELLDLESKSQESISLEEERDIDLSAYDDHDMSALSTDFKDENYADMSDPGEGPSNLQEPQIEGAVSLTSTITNATGRLQPHKLSVKEILEMSKSNCLLCSKKVTGKALYDHYYVSHRDVLDIQPIIRKCKMCDFQCNTSNSLHQHKFKKHKV